MKKTNKLISSFLVLAFVFSAFSTPLVGVKQARAGVLQDLLEAIQDKAPEASKNIILALVTSIETFLKNADTKVDARLAWNADQKAKAHEKLGEGLDWAAGVKTKVEAVDMSSDTALEEYKAIYNSAKAEWDVYRVELKRVWADILIENGKKILDASKAIRDKMTAIADKLEASNSNADTSTLSDLIRQLSAEIEESEQYYQTAIDEVELLVNSTGTEALKHFLDGQTALHQSNLNLLIDGRALLEDIILEIQRLFQEATGSSATE